MYTFSDYKCYQLAKDKRIIDPEYFKTFLYGYEKKLYRVWNWILFFIRPAVAWLRGHEKRVKKRDAHPLSRRSVPLVPWAFFWSLKTVTSFPFSSLTYSYVTRSLNPIFYLQPNWLTAYYIWSSLMPSSFFFLSVGKYDDLVSQESLSPITSRCINLHKLTQFCPCLIAPPWCKNHDPSRNFWSWMSRFR